MNTELYAQADSFFKDFNNISRRLDKHFPPPEKSGDSVELDKNEFEFVCITTREELRQHEKLTDNFFINLWQKDRCFFSGVKNGRKLKEEILSQIPEEGSSAPVCTFLIIGFRPSGAIDIDKEIPLVGSIVHYFTASRTMLVESIWMATQFPDIEREPNGEKENEKEPAEAPKMKKCTQEIVLSWLLTYNGPLSVRLEDVYSSSGKKLPRKRTSGLHRLVDKIEGGTIHAPGAMLIRQEVRNEKLFLKEVTTKNRIVGIFHETTDPMYLSVEKGKDGESEAIYQSNILRKFHRAQARYIKFNYQQPWNEEIKKYLLFTFPQVVKRPDYITIESGIVMSFIVDYARYLNPEYDSDLVKEIRINAREGKLERESRYLRDLNDCKKFETSLPPSLTGFSGNRKDFIPENSASLYENRETDHDTVTYLYSVPRIEQPRFSYKRASISFEIVVDEDYFKPVGLHFDHLEKNHDTFGSKLDDDKERKDGPFFCPLIHSTETDLFAYKYQSSPPFVSRNYSSRLQPIIVSFPSRSKFISEGRKESYFRLPESRRAGSHQTEVQQKPWDQYYHVKMLAGVSYTYFSKSSVRVWHIVVRPYDDTAAMDCQISELEIIKLMRFFSGSQEFIDEDDRRETMSKIKFDVITDKKTEDETASFSEATENKERDNLIGLLTKLTGVYYNDAESGKKEIDLLPQADRKVTLRNVTSGVIEIDTGGVTPIPHNYSDKGKSGEERYDADDFLGFYDSSESRNLGPNERNDIREMVRKFYENLNENKIKSGPEGEDFSVEDYADYVFKAYCGMSLGIFDYDRMGIQEIDDTLVPLPNSQTEESFLVIHRGVLAMFGYEDDVLESFWQTLAMNPYVLIPSAVLAHNDIVSRDVETRLDVLLQEANKDKPRFSITRIIEDRNYADNLINDNILGNVFQYKTEQELYEEGMNRRGIDQRIKDCRLKLDQLDKLIENLHQKRTKRYQRGVQVLLTIVGVFNVIPNFDKFNLALLSDPKLYVVLGSVALYLIVDYYRDPSRKTRHSSK
jgi:hypothetical protein